MLEKAVHRLLKCSSLFDDVEVVAEAGTSALDPRPRLEDAAPPNDRGGRKPNGATHASLQQRQPSWRAGRMRDQHRSRCTSSSRGTPTKSRQRVRAIDVAYWTKTFKSLAAATDNGAEIADSSGVEIAGSSDSVEWWPSEASCSSDSGMDARKSGSAPLSSCDGDDEEDDVRGECTHRHTSKRHRRSRLLLLRVALQTMRIE